MEQAGIVDGMAMATTPWSLWILSRLLIMPIMVRRLYGHLTNKSTIFMDGHNPMAYACRNKSFAGQVPPS
jgi:hypothetical protein